MYQLLIFGFVIVLFALVIMLFSHSQSLQRFAVLEFMVLVGVAVLWQISVTRNKDFLTSQYTKGKDENRKIKKYISELKKKMDIYFLTDSIYEK